MRKFRFIILFISIILLVSCEKTNEKLSINNMNFVNGVYQLEITEDVSNIDIANYVKYTNEYKIVFDNQEFLSSDKTIFTLSKGENSFIIKTFNEEIELLFIKEYTCEVILLNEELEEVDSLIIKGGSYLTINSFTIDEITIDGYFWNGYVKCSADLITFEETYIEDIKVENNLYIVPVFVANEYEINLKVDNQINTIKVKTGQLLELELLSKVGYTFIGWYASDVLLTTETRYSPNLGNEFVAKFEKNSYTITYQYLNYENVVAIEYGEEIDDFVPIIDGYQFDGWYLDSNLFDVDIYSYEEDIVLVAQMMPKEYTITYSNILEEVSQTVKYNEEFTLYTPSKEEHKFMYWEYNGEVFNEGIWNYLTDITLTAVWKKITIDLNLESFGGEVDNIATIDDNDEIILPTPILANYTFKYWCSDRSLSTKIDYLMIDDYDGETLYAYYEYQSDLLKSQTVVTIYNEHSNEYDQVTMFDSSKSGFASKYWHKIGVSKINNEYYVSNIAKSGAAITDLGVYDYIIMAYSNYAGFNDFVNLDCLIGYNVKFLVDPSQCTNGSITNIVSFIEPDFIEEIDVIHQYLEEIYGNYDKVNTDIDLVSTYNEYQIMWQSSNVDVISNLGKYQIPFSARNVTLTAYINGQEVYKFTVEVEGLNDNSNALATGYIYSPYNTITQNAMDTLDIIYCAFLDIDENGDWTNLSRITTNINTYIRPKAEISKTKIVVSVNESASGCFSIIAASSELREKLATNILNVLETLDLDGVDIDWETPTSSEAGNFTLLMEAIYNKVKNASSDYLVTAAIGGGKWQPPRYDLPNSGKYLDYVNLMTYSMATSNGYYQNSLYPSTKGRTLTSCSIDESVTIFNNLGITNNKILVGIPFYVTVQTNCDGVGSKTGTGKSVWYSEMFTTYAISDTMIEYFDEECGVPYRYDTTNKIFISFDNEESIKRKCEYINTLGLAGIMYWQYGQDVDDILSNAIGKYINQ